MGLDLSLVIEGSHNTGSTWIGTEARLYTERDYDLYLAIKALQPKPYDKQIQWPGLTGLQDVDGNEKPLTYLEAGHFAVLCDVRQRDWNYAVLMFVSSLPPLTRIVLWWH